MTLYERIKKIRLILQRPYSMFAYLPEGDVLLILESEETKRLSFRGQSIIEAVLSAEKYIESEQKTGSLRNMETEEVKEEIKTEEGEEKTEEETEKKD